MIISCKIKLSPVERNMYEGKQGNTIAKMMRCLTLIADQTGAAAFAETESKCFLSLKVGYSLSPYADLLGSLAEDKVTLADTCVDAPITYSRIKLPLFSKGTYKRMFATDNAMTDALSALGVDTYSTLKEYLSELTVEECMGKTFAWTNPTLCVYANSLLGARSEAGSELQALAQKVLGRTIVHGAIDPEKRVPKKYYSLDTCCTDPALTGAAIGYYAGGETPAIIGLDTLLAAMSPEEKQEYLYAFCSGYAATSGISMFHAFGVTPESGQYADYDATKVTSLADDKVIDFLTTRLVPDAAVKKKTFPSVVRFAPLCSLPAAAKSAMYTDDVEIALTTNARFRSKEEK